MAERLPDSRATYKKGDLVVGTYGPHDGVLYNVQYSFVADGYSDSDSRGERVVLQTQLTGPDPDDHEKVTLESREIRLALDYEGVLYKRPSTASEYSRAGIKRVDEDCRVCGSSHREWASDSMAGVHGEWCAVCGKAMHE